MSDKVIIKSNPYGIRLILDEQLPFPALSNAVAEKFKKIGSFFKDAKMAVSFEGRVMTEKEQLHLAEIIMKNSMVQIVSIIDNDPAMEQKMKKGLLSGAESILRNEGDKEEGEACADFYKGNLRSGQILESKTSVTIIGDVNPGAKVISGGNIVILGSLKGNAHAGAFGNSNCFIIALDMIPIQLQIGDLIAKSPDREQTAKRLWRKEKIRENTTAAQIAFAQNGFICIEPLTKESLMSL
ncbi:MAG TPA: septum site-determining protein MinC [Lachnospiraceae bacterium]|nr:septum site-determining protein MinC [Lachnospiraceae bacterium]